MSKDGTRKSVSEFLFEGRVYGVIMEGAVPLFVARDVAWLVCNDKYNYNQRLRNMLGAEVVSVKNVLIGAQGHPHHCGPRVCVTEQGLRSLIKNSIAPRSALSLEAWLDSYLLPTLKSKKTTPAVPAPTVNSQGSCTAKAYILIDRFVIRRDDTGRYCLNDLHRAAGGEKKHSTNYWLGNQQTKELIDELADTGIPVSVQKGGAHQGTYVVKELVYAYAMWISPSFHLKVIRTFDQVVTGNLPAVQSAFPVPKTFSEALLLAATQQQQLEHQAQQLACREEEIKELGEVIEEQAPKVEAYERFLDSEGLLSFADFAHSVGIPGLDSKRFCAWLRNQGYLIKNRNASGVGFRNLPTLRGNDLGAFKVVQRPLPDSARHVQQCKLTSKGVSIVHDLISDYLLEHSYLQGSFYNYTINQKLYH